MRPFAALVLAAVVSSCVAEAPCAGEGCGPGPDQDGGSGQGDGGTPPAPDAGGPLPDAGETPDAGSLPDAGTQVPDAGTPTPDAGAASPDAGTTSSAQRLFIPSYFYPGPLWTQATAAVPGVGVLIINPASGPGTQLDSAYLQVTQAARAAGIAVLGYVSTSYGSRDAAAVTSDIHAYFDRYPVSGIFLDEAPGTSNCGAFQQHYAALAAVVRSRGAQAMVVLNPGTDTCEGYLAFADVLCTFEGEVPAYDAYAVPAWMQSWPESRFLHLVHNVPSWDAQRVMGLSRQRRAGWVYVTDDALPNPWDTLPGYFSSELSWVSAP